MTTLDRVWRLLTRQNIPCALIGAAALAARGVARSMAGGPPVVLPADLILLKLYAGGPQDVWDIRELLKQPGMAAVARGVDEGVDAGPPAMRELWATMRPSDRP